MTLSKNEMTMKEYPQEERPIEKLVTYGPEALSDQELLAILIGSGTKEHNAISLAARLMQRADQRHWLLQATVQELMEEPGIGQTKAARIIAGLQLGNRLAQKVKIESIELTRPHTVADYLRLVFQGENRELFCVIFVDTKFRAITHQVVSIGTLNATLVHPREVFRQAIRTGCKSILLGHNHPSGDPEPSPEDIQLTKRLVKAGLIIGIDVVDHVIVGDGSYVSLKERADM